MRVRPPFSFLAVFLVGFLLLAANLAWTQDDRPCPWTISGIRAGKWANGNHKAGIWLTGSFPIPPGVSERPTFLVNGHNVGKSQIHFNMRWLPNSSHYLQPGANSVTVRFQKPPYNGASSTKTITDFDWDKVPPGGYRTFR